MIAGWLGFLAEYWPLQLLLLFHFYVAAQARPMRVLLVSLAEMALVAGWAAWNFAASGAAPSAFLGGVIFELALVTAGALVVIAAAAMAVRRVLA